MGITFGDPAESDDPLFVDAQLPDDPLFVDAQLPDGWRVEATDHSMWSNLLDDQGMVRGSIFYKAAFYDRDAFMHVVDPPRDPNQKD